MNRLAALLKKHGLSAKDGVEKDFHICKSRQAGLPLTTRRLIEQLDSLNVIEPLALDGSRLYRLIPLQQEQAELIEALRTIFPLKPAPLPLPPGSSSASTPTPANPMTRAAGG